MGASSNSKVRAEENEEDEEGRRDRTSEQERQRKKSRSKRRDSYGFLLPHLTPQQQQERLEAVREQEERASAWSFVDSSSSSSSSRGSGDDYAIKLPSAGKLKKLVRKGVPAQYRGRVWMQVSGASALKASKPSTYFKSVSDPRSKSASQVDLEQIELVRFAGSAFQHAAVMLSSSLMQTMNACSYDHYHVFKVVASHVQ